MHPQARTHALRPTVLTTAALILVGVWFHQRSVHGQRPDVGPYHTQIAQRLAGMPYSIDEWIGTDEPVTQGARDLLRANCVLRRRYRSMAGDGELVVIAVHCRNVRNLIGHYPPVCYLAQGWVLESQERYQFMFSSDMIPSTVYGFQRTTDGRLNDIQVVNFMLLPDGRVVHDMSEVTRLAGSIEESKLGAGQIQFIFDGSINPESRDPIIRRFLDVLSPFIRAVTAGPERQRRKEAIS